MFYSKSRKKVSNFANCAKFGARLLGFVVFTRVVMWFGFISLANGRQPRQRVIYGVHCLNTEYKIIFIVC